MNPENVELEIYNLKKAVKLLYLMKGGDDLLRDEERVWLLEYMQTITE